MSFREFPNAATQLPRRGLLSSTLNKGLQRKASLALTILTHTCLCKKSSGLSNTTNSCTKYRIPLLYVVAEGIQGLKKKEWLLNGCRKQEI